MGANENELREYIPKTNVVPVPSIQVLTWLTVSSNYQNIYNVLVSVL